MVLRQITMRVFSMAVQKKKQNSCTKFFPIVRIPLSRLVIKPVNRSLDRKMQRQAIRIVKMANKNANVVGFLMKIANPAALVPKVKMNIPNRGTTRIRRKIAIKNNTAESILNLINSSLSRTVGNETSPKFLLKPGVVEQNREMAAQHTKKAVEKVFLGNVLYFGIRFSDLLFDIENLKAKQEIAITTRVNKVEMEMFFIKGCDLRELLIV